MSKIHICMATDDTYAPYAGVMISSVLKHLSSSYQLVVHVLDGGISEINKSYMEKLKQSRNFEICYYPMNDMEFSHCPLTYLSIATYYRLKIGEILSDIKRVIYLDCDMVAKGDISEIWNFDLNDKILGAVEDPLSAKNMQRLGIEPTYIYFNAGLLLIDLEKWRKEKTQEKLCAALKEHQNKLRHQDQDLLNLVLCQDDCALPLRFNSQYFPYGYGNAKKQEYLSSLTNPLVIHYIMADKPWKCGSVVFRRRDYIAAFKNTPWYLEHKVKFALKQLWRGPAVLWQFLKYWYKHPICWFKRKFWRKVKLVISPLSFLR